MRDVIQKVIATEAEARRLIEAARAEAERITEAARKQGSENVARARQEARVEAEHLIEAAVRAAEQEKKTRVIRLAAEIETEVRLDETIRQQVVAGAVRCVCGLQ